MDMYKYRFHILFSDHGIFKSIKSPKELVEKEIPAVAIGNPRKASFFRFARGG